MIIPIRIFGGFATLTLVIALAVLLSDAPAYRVIPPQTGILKLSFTHGANRRAGCRQLTAEEIAALPPNMRRTEICPRRRPPVDIELAVDGDLVYRAMLPPSGLAGDGPSRAYEKFLLPAGNHEITVKMRDNPTTVGFDYEAVRQVVLAAEQNLVIDFSVTEGGFVFR